QPSPDGTKFDLRVESGTIKLAVFIPEAELRKGLAKQKDLLAGMLKAKLGEGLTGAAPPSALPVRPASANPAIHATPVITAAPAALVHGVPISVAPASPATIVTNDRGETVSVTLPGAK